MNMPEQSGLTPLQKASVCVAVSDDSNVSDRLVACQYLLGCYSQAKGPGNDRRKEKINNKFTPAKNLSLEIQEKLSFGGGKGADLSTLAKMLPKTNKTNRITNASFLPSTSNSDVKSVSFNTTTPTPTTSNKFFSSAPPPSNIPPKSSVKSTQPTSTSYTKKQEIPSKRKLSDDDEEEKEDNFRSAKDKYLEDCATKGTLKSKNSAATPVAKKSLGGKRKGFQVPFKKDEDEEEEPPPPPKKQVKSSAITKPPAQADPDTNPSGIESVNGVPLDDERLRNIEPRMLEVIVNEILDNSPKVDWNDIAGLEFAKSVVWEMVVWPMQRRDLFTGLRTPPKGLLLFGPPGTGKTLIGKAIASSSGSTFFSITASSLTSKWIGEGEKMVRAMFAVARCYQPAVIFIDEIDSLLTQRSDSEHEASRRIKNEFLSQWDGAGTSKEDHLLLVGATNRPHDLDEAARRRLVKRVYIPLPDHPARAQLITKLLSRQENSLTKEDIDSVAQQTNGYSGADLHALCSEAALGPLRSLHRDIRDVPADEVRPVSIEDFTKALRQVRASVGDTDLQTFQQWNESYGSRKGD